MKFTASQQQVIELRDKNILVSAAAGSGKTAVLVERIIQLILDEKNPVDIDKLLIVTFTNAAASEMRERIGAAIDARLVKEPENEFLQKQATLLYHAQITTIDSFCLFLVRNHFNEINLDPGFRVADPGEIKLLKQDTLNEIIEELLQSKKADEFKRLLDTLAYRGKEKVLEESILKIYDFAESFPWPEEWLTERYEDYNTGDNFTDSVWGQQMSLFLKERLEEIIFAIKTAKSLCLKEAGPVQYLDALMSDEEIVRLVERSDFVQGYEIMSRLSFARLSTKKIAGVDEQLKEVVKELRNKIKKDIDKLKEDFFSFSPDNLKIQMGEIREVEKTLIDTVLFFRKRFMEKKREKNILDFSDMEHMALDILIKRDKSLDKEGVMGFVPRQTALEYQEYFKEVMVDEYQDSNLVQEYLLQSVAGNKANRFMVGDLKQSIYKFRLARPEIFLEKYEAFSEHEEDKNRRIDLHKNFRSRKEVIESVNDVFYQIMGKSLGKVDYTEKEALFTGADYPETGEAYKTTLLLLEEGEEDSKRAEAAMVAGEIRKMVGSFLVTDKETRQPRPAKYSDIVVLLRTNTGWDEEFYNVFMEQGIPTSINGKTGYFNTAEIRTLIGFLKTLDNPRQDIPLYGTLKSAFGNFSEEEIVYLKAEKGRNLYESLCHIQEGSEASRELLRKKVTDFLKRLNKYRDMVYIMPIHKVLKTYIKETGYLYYCMSLPGGKQREANIKMLLEKAETYEKTSYFGLFYFLRYMEQLQKYEIDSPEAGILSEADDVVRIMSIHKSKGLEFPICFLSGMSKRLNLRDAQEGLICDMDLGIGMEYRSPERRVRNQDLRRNVLAEKIRKESLGEELRILYVAMTRAKEKLIMTGMVKELEKKMMSYEGVREHSEDKLPTHIMTHATSYLDFILPALVRKNKSIDIIEANPFLTSLSLSQKESKIEFEKKMLEERLTLCLAESETYKDLKEKLFFNYDHENLSNLYAKTTVSELKMKVMEEKDEASYQLFEEAVTTPYIPRFVEDRDEVSGTMRGNAYHRVMELLDFSKVSTAEELWKQMKELEREKVLDEAYLPLIRKDRMENFLSSELAARMKKAAQKGKLYRESPFVLGLPASELSKEFPSDETVLIQGIIDAYFEEEDGLVVLDYKTDRVQEEKDLINRYADQLEHYANALTRLTGNKRVKEKIIYSFTLNRMILL